VSLLRSKGVYPEPPHREGRPTDGWDTPLAASRTSTARLMAVDFLRSPSGPPEFEACGELPKYHLAVSLRDRLERTGKRFYCICFSLRSGSTLLCEDLTQWSLGSPTEFFQLVGDPVEGVSVADYVFETVAATPGSYFGFKITWDQAFTLTERLRAEGEKDATLDLRSIFPGLRSIHVVRSDKVAQAVSIWRAVNSGAWHWPVGQTIDKGTPQYDFEAIRGYLVQAVAEDWLWRSHFTRLSISHMQVPYELYIERRLKTLRTVTGFLGAKPARARLVDRLHVMRDEWSEEIVARVWSDLYCVPEPVRPASTEAGSIERDAHD
jgi:trehalose 2-sulfotransferase